MPLYETTMVARQDLSHHDVEKLIDSYVKVVQDGQGSLVKKEYWGLLDLAYKINKNRKGHYHHMCFDAPFAAMKEMERLVKLNEDIIRTLTIRVDAISNTPTPMMNKHVAAE
jgi:small subunit ribosomal protein S6